MPPASPALADPTAPMSTRAAEACPYKVEPADSQAIDFLTISHGDECWWRDRNGQLRVVRCQATNELAPEGPLALIRVDGVLLSVLLAELSLDPTDLHQDGDPPIPPTELTRAALAEVDAAEAAEPADGLAPGCLAVHRGDGGRERRVVVRWVDDHEALVHHTDGHPERTVSRQSLRLIDGGPVAGIAVTDQVWFRDRDGEADRGTVCRIIGRSALIAPEVDPADEQLRPLAEVARNADDLPEHAAALASDSNGEAR